MSVTLHDLETAYADLAAFAAQCAELTRRRNRPDETVAHELLAEMARCRGIIISFLDERIAA